MILLELRVILRVKVNEKLVSYWYFVYFIFKIDYYILEIIEKGMVLNEGVEIDDE